MFTNVIYYHKRAFPKLNPIVCYAKPHGELI